MENTRFKAYIEEKTQDYGRLFIEPLERGYGDTLGNALRRLLLSSIRGAAVTAVRIVGVLHEFSTIKGIREDVIEILMNLKHIPIRTKKDLNPGEYKIITLDSDELDKDFFTRSENPGVITAADMPWDDNFEFFGDGILCTLEQGAHLLMEIYIEQGVGYLSAERERPAFPPLPVDAMLADAIFSPVRRVNYEIAPARVGQSIDYERLILEVWTNGAVTPEGAVEEAARLAESYFREIAERVNEAPIVEEEPNPPVNILPPAPPAKPEPDPKDDRPIHELELSIRSENCLLRGGINTIGDLALCSRDDLLKIRNLGKKSLGEIEAKLASLGYSLSTNKPGSSPILFDNDDDDYDDELDSGSESEQEQALESESESESEPEAHEELAEVSESSDKASDKEVPDSEQESEPEPEVKTRSKTKTKKKSEPAPEPEADSDSDSESEPEPKPKKSRAKAKSK